jgi:serine/threonine-protein kinase
MAHPRDAARVVEAALAQRVVFVALDEGPAIGGAHALEVYAPGWVSPLVVLAQPAGPPSGAQFPLRLAPLAPEHRERLAALLSSLAALAAPAPPPPRMAPAATTPQALVGRVIGGGKYAMDRVIGSGGMGTVYLARHVTLNKPVAVKVLNPSLVYNEEFLAAFQREALAASRLDHPNVVQVLDFGREPDGLFYITMELLAGRALRDLLEQQPVQPHARIVDIMTQVCAALSASHDQHVVHRDIKPENIILVPKRDDDGSVREVVKVCDFGIAEIAGRTGAPNASLTMGPQAAPNPASAGPTRAQVTGTPDYMSPEQVRGLEADARADIYACGVILYEMATGKVPFHAAKTAAEIGRAHLSQEPTRPSAYKPDLDRRLEAIILKALAKDPAHRFANARDLRAELRATLEPPRRAMPSLSGLRPATDVDDELPIHARPRFQRDDAIDIGDLLGGRGGPAPASAAHASSVPSLAVSEDQLRARADQLAGALFYDPEGTLARVEGITDPGALGIEAAALSRALGQLAARGATAQLAVAVARIAAFPVLARALQGLAKPELLAGAAQAALDGAPAVRESARRFLLALANAPQGGARGGVGAMGALALVQARERASSAGPGWPGRPRFVATMKELGAAAIEPLCEALERAHPDDLALLEDLLRAVPEPVARAGAPASVGRGPEERLGALVAQRYLHHEAPAVRRAAAAALATAWGARSVGHLAGLLQDPDDGARITALAALRKHGAIDRDVVHVIERMLTGASAGGAELRVAAAAALGDTTGPARAAAVEALARALKPTSGSLILKLVASDASEPMVVTAMARVILAIGGAEGARAVEARASRAGPELRRQLHDLLNTPR